MPPRLIVMDEPFVGLDPKAAHLLKGMMRELCDARRRDLLLHACARGRGKAVRQGRHHASAGKLIRSGTMDEVKGDDSLEEVFLELEGETC